MPSMDIRDILLNDGDIDLEKLAEEHDEEETPLTKEAHLKVADELDALASESDGMVALDMIKAAMLAEVLLEEGGTNE